MSPSSVERGHALTLVGPSGSGKSSVLRCLNRLVEPTSGTVRFDGRDTRSFDPRELRCRVALVMQTPVMFEGTVRDNLCIRPVGVPGDFSENRLAATLDEVGLESKLLDREAATLSGGEKQRVTIARALLRDPQALLLDEPTSALDPPNALLVVETISRLRAARALSIVAVTHQPDLVRRLGGELALSDQGARRGVPVARRFRRRRRVGRAPSGVSGGREDGRPERSDVSSTANIIDLSVWQLAMALVLVGAIIVVSVRQSLGLERDLAIGTVRAIVQLYAVGLILAAVFAAARWYWITLDPRRHDGRGDAGGGVSSRKATAGRDVDCRDGANGLDSRDTRVRDRRRRAGTTLVRTSVYHSYRRHDPRQLDDERRACRRPFAERFAGSLG